jgi:acetyl esterase
MRHRARDRGGPRIDGQVLVYPVTSCDLDLPSFDVPENQQFLDRATMAWFWDRYLPDPDARTRPDASPRLATDLSGLPPALIYLAEYDPLHDDGAAYAEALGTAGVPVDLVVAEGEMHGFFQMADILPGYDTGIALVADHIARFLKENHRD